MAAAKKGTRSRGAWTRELPLIDHRLAVATPLLIGALADTHTSPTRSQRWLEPVRELFRRAGVDLILHAGDAGNTSILRELEAVAPVAAVRGNADPRDLIEQLPDRVWIEAGSRRLLLMHGHHGKTALTAARAAAAPGVDAIVFGHSHRPLITREGETILFNPGSPAERRWNPHFGVGLIRVSESAIDPDLVLFDDPRHLTSIEV